MKFLNAAAWVDSEHERVYFNTHNILIPIEHHIYPSYSRRMFESWILRRSDTRLSLVIIAEHLST